MNGGIDATRLQSWSKVDELRLVANSIKHAEGSAVEQLRRRHADLFEHPDLKENDLSSFASSPAVYLPLAGQDIYLTVGDLRDYQTAIVSFWQEFGGVIREHSQRK